MTASAADIRAAVLGPGSLFEVVDEAVRGTTMGVFRHRLRSLDELLRRTQRFGDRPFVIDGEERLSFAEHLQLVDAVAAALQDDHHVQPADRVAIFAANRWEWVVSFWAIIAAGAVPCAYNALWTTEEATRANELIQPTLIIGDAKRLARIALSDTPTLNLDDIAASADAFRGKRPRPVAVDEDDPAVLIFTSGTTARPKAVAISHRGICGTEQLGNCTETIAMATLAGAPIPQPDDDLPWRDDVVLVTSPLFHVAMLFGVVLRAASRGSSFVLLPGRFDPERVLQTIETERVTSWVALGSAGPRIADFPDRDRFDTSSVQQIAVGGAPVSPTVQQVLRDTFPHAQGRVSIGYSSTEAVSTVASLGGRELEMHPTSTGRPMATVDVQIRHPDGSRADDGQLGEIHVRSPYVMLGFWNDPAATADVLQADGWLAMGDLGRMIDGLLYIDTRARDMILVNAENVAPVEIEYRLEAHPQVIEAAVFAVDDPLTGDAVAAVVVADSVTSDELTTWCAQTLARYKVPTRWRIISEPLSRTPTGKLNKNSIRQLFDS